MNKSRYLGAFVVLLLFCNSIAFAASASSSSSSSSGGLNAHAPVVKTVTPKMVSSSGTLITVYGRGFVQQEQEREEEANSAKITTLLHATVLGEECAIVGAWLKDESFVCMSPTLDLGEDHEIFAELIVEKTIVVHHDEIRNNIVVHDKDETRTERVNCEANVAAAAANSCTRILLRSPSVRPTVEKAAVVLATNAAASSSSSSSSSLSEDDIALRNSDATSDSSSSSSSGTKMTPKVGVIICEGAAFLVLLYVCVSSIFAALTNRTGPIRNGARMRDYSGVFENDMTNAFISGITAMWKFGALLESFTDQHGFFDQFRYLSYILSCPLIIWDMTYSTGGPYRITSTMVTFVCLVMSLLSDIIPSPAIRWGWFGAGCLVFIILIVMVYKTAYRAILVCDAFVKKRPSRGRKMNRIGASSKSDGESSEDEHGGGGRRRAPPKRGNSFSSDVSHALSPEEIEEEEVRERMKEAKYLVIAAVSLLFWVWPLFPIMFCLEHGGAISREAATMCYAIMDITAKAVHALLIEKYKHRLLEELAKVGVLTPDILQDVDPHKYIPDQIRDIRGHAGGGMRHRGRGGDRGDARGKASWITVAPEAQSISFRDMMVARRNNTANQSPAASPKLYDGVSRQDSIESFPFPTAQRPQQPPQQPIRVLDDIVI